MPIVTAGLVERGGHVHPLEELDTKAMKQHFRELVLARTRRAERLSVVLQKRLLFWEHSGFSVHAGETIPASNRPAEGAPLEWMARCMTRARGGVTPGCCPLHLEPPACRAGGRMS